MAPLQSQNSFRSSGTLLLKVCCRKIPLVGVAYLAAGPDKSPFVSVGMIKKGQTLMIIEAMKVMNEVPAPKRWSGYRNSGSG